MDASYDPFIKELLASNKSEAREWLRAASEGAYRILGEMDPVTSMSFVERLYDLGAEIVLAVEIHDSPEGASTDSLLVELPADYHARERLFSLEREQAESMGFEGEPDEGQVYLYFKVS